MAVCSNICIERSIVTDCGSSMGGIVEVVITNWSDKTFTPSEKNPGKVEAGTGAVCGQEQGIWYLYEFRRGTSSLSSTLNIDEANGTNYVSTELVMTFNRMEADKRLAITALAQAPMAVIVKDANGKYWALGNDEPVYASAGEGVTGTSRTDSNHYSITLLDNSAQFPFEVVNGAAIFEAAHESA